MDVAPDVGDHPVGGRDRPYVGTESEQCQSSPQRPRCGPLAGRSLDGRCAQGKPQLLAEVEKAPGQCPELSWASWLSRPMQRSSSSGPRSLALRTARGLI